jgi:hypothetical protein
MLAMSKGAVLVMTVPSPIWPFSLSPQQNRLPVLATTHECMPPHDSDIEKKSEAAAPNITEGMGLLPPTVPSPTCP